MLVLGVVVSVPACLLAAFAPTIKILVAARILGGVAAGLAFPRHSPSSRRCGMDRRARN
jgi:predicted MFS family arabinose efflux permease